MTPAQRFLMMTQGRQPRPVANMMRQYQTPGGITPPMALRRPQPPAPAMPAAPRLSPMMQRVAQQAAMPRMTPPTGAVTPPPTTPPAGGQPSGFMGAFSQPLTSPVGQAISQAAIAGARASDWSPTPVSLGRVLAEMGAAASQGYAAGEERQRLIEDRQQPKIQVAGKDIFRIFPDGRVERLTGGRGPEPIEIKSEAGRYVTDDGRVINAVLGKNGKLYEAGNVAAGQELDPAKMQIVDQYTTMDYSKLEKHKADKILAPEKTLRLIDNFAQQIEAGPEGFVQRQKAKVSSAIKNLSENTEYNQDELMLALQQGTLTQLVGAARLELFGPGVMTEFEQAMAREILAGNFDRMNKSVALQRLNSFRKSFLSTYEDAIKTYNRQPIVKAEKMQLKPYSGFDWSKVGSSTSAAGGASSANTTTGGNTWSVVTQ
jgi:hypothetical protein